jgi:hypothetical protein
MDTTDTLRTDLAPEPSPDHSSRRSSLRALVGVPIGLAAIITVLLLAFAWPAVTADVHALPIALVGPAQQTSQVQAALEQNKPGAFDIVTADDRAAAVSLIESRDVYGAIVLGDKPEVLSASAASPVVAQLFGSLATELSGQLTAAAAAQGIALPAPIVVAVTDVVPLPDTDPRGVGLISASFPMVIGGVIGGIGIFFLIRGVGRRVAAVLVFAVVGGLALAGILQGLFGSLTGSYLLNSAAIALALAAIGTVVVGLASLIGRPGIVLSVILFVLFANPLSAATQPVEFLLEPWGAIGQWMPPGAGATLVREISYFPAADASFSWLVLSGWVVLGAAIALVAGALGRRRATV